MKPGSKVLYLGAASGTSVSHVADIVGPTGAVYAVEFSHRSGRDLINMATRRTNVIPIVEDARHAMKYRMLMPMVDVVFADVAQPDQARIVALNSKMYLKQGGGLLISIKANCIDSTAPPEAVFASELKKLKEDGFFPKEQLTLGKTHTRARPISKCGSYCMLTKSQNRTNEITPLFRQYTSKKSLSPDLQHTSLSPSITQRVPDLCPSLCI